MRDASAFGLLSTRDDCPNSTGNSQQTSFFFLLPMGLTLLEAAKLAPDAPTGAVIAELAEGELMRRIPFQNVPGSGVFYSREAELPAVGFRGINEALPEGYGVINPQSEPLKIFGGDLDVDIAEVDMYGPSARATQTQMKVKALRMTYEDKFLNGSSAENPREMDGLKSRIIPGTSQYLSNFNEAGTAGSALSLNVLDHLLDEVEANGSQRYLIMNKAMRRRLSQAARTQELSGCIIQDRDEIGQQVTRYQDAIIITTDTNASNRPIQAFDEPNADGSAGNTTSIYAVAFGDTLTTGIQGQHGGAYGISVRDLGEVNDKPCYRTRLDWYIGMAIYHGRSVARLAGVNDDVVIA